MDRPEPDAVWRAIDIYLKHAYDGPPPPPVAARLESLRAAAAEQLYACPSFEHRSDDGADRVSLRLGNRRYPHMKLVIERASGRSAYCFFADTHDEHAAPEPGAVDYDEFQALMQHNRTTAKAIELAWASAGLLTFNQLLLAERERRRAASAPPQST